jgi:multidrug efflux pump subunit AcrB
MPPQRRVDAAGARVRTGAATRSAEGIAALTLRTNDDGSALTIGDVARIEVGAVTGNVPISSARTRVSIRVDRSEDGDAIAIQGIVEEWPQSSSDACPKAPPST